MKAFGWIVLVIGLLGGIWALQKHSCYHQTIANHESVPYPLIDAVQSH
jgi:hypothetical protein